MRLCVVKCRAFGPTVPLLNNIHTEGGETRCRQCSNTDVSAKMTLVTHTTHDTAHRLHMGRARGCGFFFSFSAGPLRSSSSMSLACLRVERAPTVPYATACSRMRKKDPCTNRISQRANYGLPLSSSGTTAARSQPRGDPSRLFSCHTLPHVGGSHHGSHPFCLSAAGAVASDLGTTLPPHLPDPLSHCEITVHARCSHTNTIIPREPTRQEKHGCAFDAKAHRPR